MNSDLSSRRKLFNGLRFENIQFANSSGWQMVWRAGVWSFLALPLTLIGLFHSILFLHASLAELNSLDDYLYSLVVGGGLICIYGPLLGALTAILALPFQLKPLSVRLFLTGLSTAISLIIILFLIRGGQQATDTIDKGWVSGLAAIPVQLLYLRLRLFINHRLMASCQS